MIGHYVEDDALDAFSLMGLINGEGDLSMTTSKSLNDFADWVTPNDVDFVLLDINRPDARSLEKDVARIRESSKAPIVFITGDEAQYYREQAILAGAQAVIEKDSLTIRTLNDVLKGVVSDRGPSPLEDWTEHHLVASNTNDLAANGSADKYDGALSYIRTMLNALAKSDANPSTIQSNVTLLSEAVGSLQRYCVSSPVSAGPPRPLPGIVRSIQKAALISAKQADCRLIFQMGVEVLEDLQDLDNTQLAIRHLLHASLLGSPADNTITFVASPVAGGIRLTMSSREPFAFDASNALRRYIPEKANEFGPTIALTLAIMLLDVGEESVSQFSRGSLNTVIIEKSETGQV